MGNCKGLDRISKMKINPDSILIENIVRFSKVQSEKAETRIDFTLKVTNLGSAPIPDLGVANRMEQVHFFINEKELYPPGLGNGREVVNGDKTITKGLSQTFTQGWTLSADNGLQKKYGYLFTVQWTYNGIKSPLVKVDLYNQKAKVVYPQAERAVDSAVLKRSVNFSETKTVGTLLNWLNNSDKLEMDAYYNHDAYPNYIVSGETNGLISSCTKSLASMGIQIDWDTDRLMYRIKPNAPVTSETIERLKMDLWKVLAANKYLDLKGFDTLKFFIGDNLLETVQKSKLSSLNFEELEKKDTASIRKKIVKETLPNLMKQYSFEYANDTMTITHSVDGSAMITYITKAIYNAKGFLLSEEKWDEGPDAFGGGNLIENSFDNNNKVYRICTRTKPMENRKEIIETIDVDYLENTVLVKSKYGTIRALFVKK